MGNGNDFERSDQVMLWLDLECTGLDEKEDDILEVGYIITDGNFNELESGYELVQPSQTAWDRMKNIPVVYDMHSGNGLVQEIEQNWGSLPSSEKVGEGFAAKLAAHGARPRRAILAGSGVSHYDRRFIRENMPALDGACRRQMFDVSVLRMMQDHIVGNADELTATDDGGPSINSLKPHRGLDDIRLHLDEGQRYVDEIFLRADQHRQAEQVSPQLPAMFDDRPPWRTEENDQGFPMAVDDDQTTRIIMTPDSTIVSYLDDETNPGVPGVTFPPGTPEGEIIVCAMDNRDATLMDRYARDTQSDGDAQAFHQRDNEDQPRRADGKWSFKPQGRPSGTLRPID